MLRLKKKRVCRYRMGGYATDGMTSTPAASSPCWRSPIGITAGASWESPTEDAGEPSPTSWECPTTRGFRAYCVSWVSPTAWGLRHLLCELGMSDHTGWASPPLETPIASARSLLGFSDPPFIIGRFGRFFVFGSGFFRSVFRI